ncbi:GYD domain-containing protein [Candidatus Omnitrophota bacterium]
MAKFLMLGKYSLEAVKGLASERTKKVVGVVEKNAGKVISMYALAGVYDLVFILDFPDISHALKTSVEITKLTGISLTTSPAVTVEEFDKIVSQPGE